MKKLSILLLLIIGIALSSSQYIYAQTKQDLSSINVDDLTDSQISKFTAQMEASGLPISQLEQVAAARGMSADQIAKLKARVNTLQSKNPSSTDKSKKGQNNNFNGRTYDFNTKDSLQNGTDDQKNQISLEDVALNMLKSKIFGADLFKNNKITFEPNLRIATPENYQIGSDDEILIDIYGNSEASYNLKVSPEGKINIPYIGLISVANMTVAQASARIKSQLSKVYKAMNNGLTKVDISLGNIRSIKVILTGEIVKPGTYTLSSLSTVMNALYASGGPTDNGSFRKVLVIRGGNTIAKVDIYDFLINGALKNNVRLQDQDVIRVPAYENRVEIIGEVKRPGIYELKQGENFSDLLTYTGGFNEFAYKARVKILKNTDTERKIQDVTIQEFTTYHPNTGDKVFVDKILDRFENRVSIGGAVFRPGAYSLDETSTVKQLIQKAEGLKEDAYKERGYILRQRENSEPELVSFNIGGLLNGSIPDINLSREDSVVVKSIYDLRENYTVKVNGEVIKPGTIPFAEGMTLNDVILRSGGFTEKATGKRIEIASRIRNSNSDSSTNKTALIIEINQGKTLSDAQNIIIKPFDIITIRPAPGYEVQRQILLEGEVLYPGYYTMKTKDEKISDIVTRAGGLTQWAYAEGASLKRAGGKDLLDSTQLDREKERKKIAQFKKLQSNSNDTVNLSIDNEAIRNDFVGINLEKILKKPGSKDDIYLKDGDIINVPIKYQTVAVSGEILSPSKVIFSANRSLKNYINNAGGFSSKADKSKVYVTYANGGVLGTKRFFFIKNYPRIKPGAEIFVPKREERRKISAGEIVGMGSGLASIAAILLTLLK